MIQEEKMLSLEDKSITDFVKQKTGAKSVIIIICDSKVPCQEETQNGMCKNPHTLSMIVDGFKRSFISGTFEQVLEGMKGNIPSALNL